MEQLIVDGDLDFCVFDCETTGLDDPEITEIGAVRRKDEEWHQFQTLVCPSKEIEEEAQEITGITMEMVKDKPTIHDVLDDFVDFVGQSIMIAHNIQFDLGCLHKPLDRRFPNDKIDTLQMARAQFSLPRYTLDFLIQEFNISREEGHRALSDARATANLFVRMVHEGKFETRQDYQDAGIPGSIQNLAEEKGLIS